MHKGYAFVQFTNPFDARNACHGEDGRTVLSQVLGEFYHIIILVSFHKIKIDFLIFSSFFPLFFSFAYL